MHVYAALSFSYPPDCVLRNEWNMMCSAPPLAALWKEKKTPAQGNVFPWFITVWNLCIRCASPMQHTSCAAGLVVQPSAGGCEVLFNTTLPCAFEEAVMSCNWGRIIIVWIPESDVRGRGKLAHSQNQWEQRLGELAEAQVDLKTFPYSLAFFLLSLKA